jgi:hypothetical protein
MGGQNLFLRVYKMSNLLLEKLMCDQDHAWGKDQKCSFCGNIPKAGWHGEQNVFVCSSCATAVLPKLIADASMFPEQNPAGHIIRSIEKNFWKATAWLYRKRLKNREKNAG